MQLFSIHSSNYLIPPTGNYLLISKVLFPNSLLGHAYTAAYLQNPKAFMRILPWIKCNSAEITRLQNYYRSLPTQQFQTIIDMNKVESNRLNSFLKQEEKRLPIIIDYLKQSVNNIHHIGLKDGLMGVVLAFSLYADYYKDESTHNFADRIFESIYDTFDKETPITFGNGACGIGWCILYLQTIGLLNKNMEDWLQMIDSMIMEREPKRIQDMSFDTGLGGIIQYVITRINYCRYNHIELIFDKKYLHSIKLAGKRLIHNQYTEKRSIMATMELLILSNNHMYDLDIDLAEILNLPKVLPNDFKYWQANLNSATGYLINISNKINRLR